MSTPPDTDAFDRLRARLYASSHLPPGVVRARRRIEWGKTFALMAFFGGVMTAHVGFVWDPSGPLQTFMVGTPIALYGTAILIVLLSRVVQIPAHRARLRAARERFQEHEDAVAAGDTSAYSELLASVSGEQSRDLELLGEAKEHSRGALTWSSAATAVGAGVFALNVALCVGIEGSVLFGLTSVFFGLAFLIQLFGWGNALKTAIDDHLMHGHLEREVTRLRDMRRDVLPEELTGALSAPTDARAQGALSQAAARAADLALADRDQGVSFGFEEEDEAHAEHAATARSE
jgi:hypothetical protein